MFHRSLEISGHHLQLQRRVFPEESDEGNHGSCGGQGCEIDSESGVFCCDVPDPWNESENVDRPVCGEHTDPHSGSWIGGGACDPDLDFCCGCVASGSLCHGSGFDSARAVESMESSADPCRSCDEWKRVRRGTECGNGSESISSKANSIRQPLRPHTSLFWRTTHLC